MTQTDTERRLVTDEEAARIREILDSVDYHEAQTAKGIDRDSPYYTVTELLDTREALIEALGRIAEPNTVSEWEELLDDGFPNRVRIAIIQAQRLLAHLRG